MNHKKDIFDLSNIRDKAGSIYRKYCHGNYDVGVYLLNCLYDELSIISAAAPLLKGKEFDLGYTLRTIYNYKSLLESFAREKNNES